MDSWNYNCTVGMWAAIVPSFFVGFVCAWMRFRYFQVEVVQLFR